MAKGSGNTRTVSSNNASATRTTSNATVTNTTAANAVVKRQRGRYNLSVDEIRARHRAEEQAIADAKARIEAAKNATGDSFKNVTYSKASILFKDVLSLRKEIKSITPEDLVDVFKTIFPDKDVQQTLRKIPSRNEEGGVYIKGGGKSVKISSIIDGPDYVRTFTYSVNGGKEKTLSGQGPKYYDSFEKGLKNMINDIKRK